MASVESTSGAPRYKGWRRSLPRTPLFVSVLAALTYIVVPRPASAFRTLAETSQFSDAKEPIVWSSEVIQYTIGGDVPRNLSRAMFQDAVLRQFRVWESVQCAALRTSNLGFTSAMPASGDGVNTIAWVLDEWPYEKGVGAHTDIVTRKQDRRWLIVEADIFLNGADFDWTIDGSPADGKRDLQSILLHEIGHFVGLAHPCAADQNFCGDSCANDDEEGLPRCGDSDDALVMNPVYEGGRLSLSEDDQAGICHLYPRSNCDGAEDCEPGRDCVAGACRSLCDGAICGVDEVCSGGRCADPRCIGGNCGQCIEDTQCPLAQKCIEDACVTGDGLSGDPCVEDVDCRLGGCERGHCVNWCASDDDCPGRVSCAPSHREGFWGVCVAPGEPFGGECAAGLDCVSGECLTSDSGDNICTRTCGPNAECPDGFDCKGIAGKSVCAPRLLVPGGGGCSFRPISNDRHHTSVGALALSLLAAAGLRCRKIQLVREGM